VGQNQMHCLKQNKWHDLVSESRLEGSKINLSYQIGAGGFSFRV
jgi:hypothetical protein